MPPPDPARAAIEQLLDELRLAREALARLTGEVATATEQHTSEPPGPIIIYGCGALLHGYYTALERCLAAATRHFESEPPQRADWHRRLLVAAASDRPGRRPPILTPDTLASLDRYLRFRHLFRNLYVFELDWTELRPLLDRLGDVHRAVDADLTRFESFLRSLITGP